MANKPQLKAVGEQDFSESDPFAELTRIMGFDPRVQPTPRPEDDFHIDLEKELMGEFGGEDGHEGGTRQAQPTEGLQGQAAHPGDDHAARPAVSQPLAEDLEDALTSAFEQEFEEVASSSDGEAGFPPADLAAAEADVSGEAARPDAVASKDAPNEMDVVADRGPELAESLNRLLTDAGYKSGSSFSGAAQVYQISTSYVAAPTAAEPPAVPAPEETEMAPPAPLASEDAGEAAPSVGHRSTVFGTPTPEWAAGRPDAAFPDAIFNEAETNAVAEPAPAPPVGTEAFLEEEGAGEPEDPFAVLAALGDEPSQQLPDTSPPAPEYGAGRPVGEMRRFEGAARFYSSPDLFSRATPVPPGMKQPSRVPAPAKAPEAQPRMPQEPEFATGEEPAFAASIRPQEAEPDVIREELSADIAAEAPEAKMPETAMPETAIYGEAAEADAADAALSEASGRFLPETDDEAQAGEARAGGPQAGEHDLRPHDRRGVSAPATAPEIETIAIPEPAVAIEDDLDIPTPPVEETPPAPAFDDIDHEFVAAFADFQPNDRKAPAEPAASNEDEELTARIEELFEAEEFDFSEQAAAAPAQSAQPGYQAAAPRASEERASSASEAYGFQDEYYDAGAAPAYADAPGEAAAYPSSRLLAIRDRRGPLVAAVIGCVVIAGAVGVYAYSHNAVKDSGPVLLKADAQPVKVKPKHPGGTKVPNQNNQVYKRVADGDVAAPVQQQKLVTSIEKPVDLGAQAKSEAAASVSASSLPGVEVPKIPQASSQEIAALAKAEANQPQKNQDRLPASRATGADTSRVDDVIAVEPRKVRTMIVKPDGTMVPTPMPASVQPAAPKSVTSAALEAPAAKAPAAAKPADNGTVVTPRQVDVTPSRPAEQPAATREPARDEKVASVTPAPVAAAASGWAMQIASQPSAEAAQTSYQRLAHRYGNVLGGHGVDIVKAEIAGKGTYYRVRVPTSSREEAINLCTKYKAAGGNCFVSK
jgi:hypothetical protein